MTTTLQKASLTPELSAVVAEVVPNAFLGADEGEPWGDPVQDVTQGSPINLTKDWTEVGG